MSQPNSLASDSWKKTYTILLRWSHMGRQEQQNGTQLIGRVPHVAPMAWLHSTYLGLDDKELKGLEARIGHILPSDYRDFLSLSNGIKAFSDSFVIFGMPRGSSRGSVASREPYDLTVETLHTRAMHNMLCVGAIEDEFLYLEAGASGKRDVFRCKKGDIHSPIQSWPNLWVSVEMEIERLAEQFDEQGHRFSQ